MPDIQVSEKLISFFIFIPFFLLSITVHEFAHAFVAEKFGDSTAKQAGRYTLNPIKHLDLIGSIILPFMSFLSGFLMIGWAKPVPINRNNFKRPFRDDAIVSAAGPFSNFLLAIIFFILSLFFIENNAKMSDIFYYGTIFNIFLFAFNLLPIPPLDGSHIIFDLFPNKFTAKWLNLGFYGTIILLLFIYSPLWGYFIKVLNFILDLFFFIAGYK